MHTGWYQLAYERDLKQGANALTLEGHALLVVYNSELAQVDVYDGVCPHRGYLLGVAGKLQHERIICPFHGYAIGLGEQSNCHLHVARRNSLLVAGLLFVRMGEESDCGFAERIEALDRTHYITPGFTRRLKASSAMVVENAFDVAHFQPVHNISNVPQMAITEEPASALHATARFHLPASPWQGGRSASVPFTASAYSPTLVLTELGGEHPYIMLTATLELPNGECEVRLSVMVPMSESAQAPSLDGIRYLLQQAEAGIEKDIVIWEHLVDGGAVRNAMPADESVIAFRRFCRRFHNG